MNYNNAFGSQVIALSGIYFSPNLTASTGNYFNISYNFLVSMNNSKIYVISVAISLIFNQTTHTLDYVNVATTNSLIVTFSENIVKMLRSKTFRLILMQSVSNKYYFYNYNTGSTGTGSTNMSSFIMNQVI